ncbi:MAG TPA: oligosaccharide flippase family protein [Synechococcales cyanobacterium M55_K2018_004]|nr:oligosaccharide flippase family protein [Synechococcales cyanobacterium M55_K2018_004]
MEIAKGPSLKKLAIKGIAWTVVGYGASQILRFGSNLILTRLLFPELFGLMSLVYVFITGLHLFSDLGLNASIIKSKRGDEPDFLNTTWTLQVIRGTILWFCCLIIALPASRFYNEPSLMWLIPVVGFNTFISGFNSTYFATLERHLAVKTKSLLELGFQVIGLVITVAWAWLNPSIWSLVGGALIVSLLQLFVSHWINKGEANQFAWDQSAFQEIFSFGKWMFLSTVIWFFASQTDRLILGKLFSLEMLGVYGIAFTLADIPRQIVFAIAARVIYPTYSKLVDLPREQFRAKIMHYRKPLLIAATVGIALAAGLGDLIIDFLYDERYAAAGWMFPLLSLGVWPLVLIQTIDQGLWVLEKPFYWTIGLFFSFLFCFIGIPWGFHSSLGNKGAVLAVAVSNVPIWIVVLYGLWREKLLALRQDLLMTVVLMIIFAMVVAIRLSLGLGSPFNGLMGA